MLSSYNKQGKNVEGIIFSILLGPLEHCNTDTILIRTL